MAPTARVVDGVDDILVGKKLDDAVLDALLEQGINHIILNMRLVKFINSVNEDLGSQRLSHKEDKITSIASTAAKGTGEKRHRHTGAQ